MTIGREFYHLIKHCGSKKQTVIRLGLTQMKTRKIIGLIFIVVFVLLLAAGIWAFVTGIPSWNVNFILGPLFGIAFLFLGVGFLIAGLIMTIKN